MTLAAKVVTYLSYTTVILWKTVVCDCGTTKIIATVCKELWNDSKDKAPVCDHLQSVVVFITILVHLGGGKHSDSSQNTIDLTDLIIENSEIPLQMSLDSSKEILGSWFCSSGARDWFLISYYTNCHDHWTMTMCLIHRELGNGHETDLVAQC